MCRNLRILKIMTYGYANLEMSVPLKENKNMGTPPRTAIAKLARAARGGLITVPRASEALGLSRRAAAMKLAALARRGWLLRARQGLYLILPLEVEPGRPMVAEDPWVLAREAFRPCYVGGWSAAEYWGLTEQLFRSTLVVTAAHVRTRSVLLLNHEFRLFRVPRTRIDGAILIWRGRERVPVSDRERTIVDCLRYPELCGGIRHLVHLMESYGSSQERNLQRLAYVAHEAGTGAVWKRLGYIAELLWPEEQVLRDEAAKHLTAGNVRLDPMVRQRGTLLRRWRLWINVTVGGETDAS
jgi:predicted transcriptional regulator of viral defense system